MLKKIIKIGSYLLLSVIVIGVFASCSGNTGTATDTTANQEHIQTETETDKFIKDNLPSDLNYGGKTVNWLIGDYFQAYLEDFYSEAETGSLVSDEVYAANRRLEERLEINLNMIIRSFPYSEVNTIWTQPIVAAILAGDSSYDIISGYTLVSLLTEGEYFMDLSSNKYIDLEMPWWNQDIQDIFPSNKIYLLTGDGTMSLMKHSFCVFFNQNLLNDLSISENLYETVSSGSWTIDRIEKIIADSYADLDGDGAATYMDRWGVTFGDLNKYRGFSSANDVEMYHKETDGSYTLTFGNQRSTDVMDKLYIFIHGNDNVLPAISNADNEALVATWGGNYSHKAFVEGRALFSYSLIGDASIIFANNDFSFGMIPYPKFDEEQDDYYTSAQRFAHFYIPITCGDFDMSGAIIEAWSSECYRTVMPLYFETNLKVRYSADNDMAQMFDLLKKNTRAEFGMLFASRLSLNVDSFKTALQVNANSWATLYAANEAKTNNELIAILDALS